ncbi:MAG TPA: sulfite exporter TauE/SafE family protein [Thermoanaerobaculia bacterium]
MTLASLVIFAAGIAAGAINSIAGGGTLISFPALLWAGRDPIVANATNTVAMWPGSLAGAYGFRNELKTVRGWLLLLIVPSLLGGALGSWLLLRTPSSVFERLVPFLILGATLLLAAQEMITRRLGVLAHAHENPTRGWVAFVFLFQLLVGTYGGYFGAGMGILMLAALGLIGLTDLHQMNGLKNVLAVAINGIAAIYFVFANAVVWRDVLVMTAGTILGGYLGARVARRLGRKFVRVAVVVIGLFMTIALFLK